VQLEGFSFHQEAQSTQRNKKISLLSNGIDARKAEFTRIPKFLKNGPEDLSVKKFFFAHLAHLREI